MRNSLAVLAVIGLFGGVLAGVAGACTCGDRDGCGSALACAGKSPDDDCTPPKGGTCKVLKGFSGVFTCCCSCRKGNAAAAACTGFSEVKASLGVLKEQSATCGKQAKGAAKATAAAATTTLGQAEKACNKNQAPKEDAKIATTAKTLTKFETKVRKFADKHKLTEDCKKALISLADDIISETHNAGNTTVAPPTTTTTLPNPLNINCSGVFTPFDPSECNYLFSCSGSGTSPFNAYGILVTGRQLTNKIDPPGFSCTFGTIVTTNDYIWCQGAVPLNTDVTGGRLHFVPNWTTGMGAALRMYENGNVAATYNITGP